MPSIKLANIQIETNNSFFVSGNSVGRASFKGHTDKGSNPGLGIGVVL